MMRPLLFALALGAVPAASFAQHHDDHAAHAVSAPAAPDSAALAQPGQAAFGAITELVTALEADPRTDWSRVDVERLRRHLVDMDNVILAAAIEQTAIPGGARFTVTGPAPIAESVKRMAAAHARAMDGEDGWAFALRELRDGVEMEVTGARPDDAARIRGLGFAGILARGGHHQAHHYAIASGNDPH